MKKITYPIFSFILFIFITGCAGYKPIFSSTNFQFKIADFSIEDNKMLGKKIYSKLLNLSKSTKDDQNIRNIDLLIQVSKDKNATSKNSAGKILEYKITLNTKVEIKDFVTDDKILYQTLISSLTYKVQNQYSDTVNLENTSIENLINKIFIKSIFNIYQINTTN